jgi:hypothetical protein
MMRSSSKAQAAGDGAFIVGHAMDMWSVTDLRNAE